MRLFSSKLYCEDVKYVANIDLPWEKLQNNSILLSGATGQFGSFLTDVIMYRNKKGLNCKVYALGRNEEKAKKRFDYCAESEYFEFIKYDINEPLITENIDKIGYVIHLASNTHPVQYASNPIGTIITNIIGVKNMLDYCVEHHADGFAFASSNEVYGENRGDVELFDELYCGYIDCNTMRAGYPESKRCGEALCQAYISQKGLDVVIPRFTRSFGPTLLQSDTKASSQFIHKALAGEDIVLKSDGTQYYSYTYTADAVAGLLFVLLKGECGSSYNIASSSCDVMLKDLALKIANCCDKKVIFEIPEELESAGYSCATKARLSGNKLQSLGWMPKFDLSTGIERTIRILKNNQNMEGIKA
ncbi:Nucleoside-diphosphate-sugar epimerase [Kandleria vitulina]|uniref:Nucleoside-diphosphate-sugar epimerase n=1 Tax=Kandleria vitulina TaxID=1630 RepID=A0A1H2VN26_9FIRM|nr:NAD-dependent epimerase/dehydratase family protein [Kandleria vitulina]SDW69696.1 Nucleoside-diphosphate-sugar epimerase [Kandleria vitulina]